MTQLRPAPFWITVYLDRSEADHDAALAFWAAVTGYAVSERRGEAGEFCTLLPPTGDDHLGLQRLGGHPSRLHLDLHVTVPRAAALDAVERGASVLHESEHGYVVLRSPGGMVFCLVAHPASTSADPASWPGGRSMVDQVCLDIPASRYDAECRFWQELTGREPAASTTRPEFGSLPAPPGQPLRLLLQRLDQPQPEVTAHLDIACEQRAAETERHQALGARVLATEQWWTVLADPTGASYCLTDRAPSSGRA